MNKKLYIPDIGDQIILAEDWKFELHPETRNRDLGTFFGHYYKSKKVKKKALRFWAKLSDCNKIIIQ